MKSVIIAFAMYSKLPMPRVDWEKKALSWALCWFPLVGLFIGAALWLWLALAHWLGFGTIFTAAFPVKSSRMRRFLRKWRWHRT